MLTEIHGRLSYKQSSNGFYVVDLGIGNVKFPETIISSGDTYFATIPKREFDSLETNGAIRDASGIKEAHARGGYLDRVGYANIWITGTEESVVPAKLYRNATVVRSNDERTYLGLPFIFDFDLAEFWINGRCALRFSVLEEYFELFDDRPDKKEGFYGFRNPPVSDISDLLDKTEPTLK